MLNADLGNIKFVSFINTTANNAVDALKEKWNELPLDCIIMARIDCKGLATAMIQKAPWHTHGSAIVFGYGYSRPVFVKIYGGSWSERIDL